MWMYKILFVFGAKNIMRFSLLHNMKEDFTGKKAVMRGSCRSRVFSCSRLYAVRNHTAQMPAEKITTTTPNSIGRRKDGDRNDIIIIMCVYNRGVLVTSLPRGVAYCIVVSRTHNIVRVAVAPRRDDIQGDSTSTLVYSISDLWNFLIFEN